MLPSLQLPSLQVLVWLWQAAAGNATKQTDKIIIEQTNNTLPARI
jgi:hypothetical protein